jgi:hypothetical protein
MHKACKKTLEYAYCLPAYPTAAAVRLPGLVAALLRYLLQLWLEFLYQPIEAFALQKAFLGKAPFSEFS